MSGVSFSFIFFAGSVVGAFNVPAFTASLFLKPTGWGMSVVDWEHE